MVSDKKTSEYEGASKKGTYMPFNFPAYINDKINATLSLLTPQRVEYVQDGIKIKPKSSFKIAPERIIEDGRTTYMIKNIPNKYTSKMLIAFINETHFATYDFFYLRIDFKNRCNVGYAFINFISPVYVLSFYKRLHGQRWPTFSSQKIAELAYASVQGIENSKKRFRRSTVMLEDPEFRPKFFYTSGKKRGMEKNFTDY